MNGGNDLIFETNIFPELMLDQNEAAFGSGTVQCIIVTAPHRDDAFSGSRFILEKIKEYVPI